ncbi:hypothetical protein NDU88_010192 [Pleurodeles waltl]|uniref:Uncharacterized protein n=1 Tax=Pleurodeles waltl TaxID=8319 RepID=A0AAV7PXZ6_PLEWA|nr:hypothetical protein NDU88_010192 [Pleurodeles waltl]
MKCAATSAVFCVIVRRSARSGGGCEIHIAQVAGDLCAARTLPAIPLHNSADFPALSHCDCWLLHVALAAMKTRIHRHGCSPLPPTHEEWLTKMYKMASYEWLIYNMQDKGEIFRHIRALILKATAADPCSDRWPKPLLSMVPGAAVLALMATLQAAISSEPLLLLSCPFRRL